MSLAFHWYSLTLLTAMEVFDPLTLCALHVSAPTLPYVMLPFVAERSVAQLIVANPCVTSVR